MSEEAVRDELKLLRHMIEIYCKKKHRTHALCKDCTALYEYARQRSENCPMREKKTFCGSCPVHCYKPDMREEIRAVMRFAGPRMIFYHPCAALRHFIDTMRQKKRRK